MYVIGVDPGKTTGICGFDLGGYFRDNPPWPVHYPISLQCTPESVEVMLEALRLNTIDRPVIALEKFVLGPRSARLRKSTDGRATLEVIESAKWWAENAGCPVRERSAAQVKPWASDKRLEAAGLLEPTAGFPHARDAARHAMFIAVDTWRLPDPLSQEARA